MGRRGGSSAAAYGIWTSLRVGKFCRRNLGDGTWIPPVLKLELATLEIAIVCCGLAGNWNGCVVVIVTVPFKRCAPLVATIARVGDGNEETESDGCR